MDDDWESRYCSWNFLAEEAWERLSERLPPEERALARGAFGAMRTTSNFASLRHLQDREIRRSAHTWVQESYRRWLADGRTSAPPSNGPAEFEAVTGTASGISLGDLIYYRSGFRKLPARSLKPGVALGYLSNKGSLDEFALGSAYDIELTVFHEIARAHGGEHLALWTYGHAVHLWHARSPKPGAPPEIVRAGFRLHHPGASPRAALELTLLRSQLQGSVLAPDWDEVRAQLDAGEISVTRWFSAFGVPGANEIVPLDREAVWSQMERVCLDLLNGRPTDRSAIRQLNLVLGNIDEDSRLSSRSGRRPTVTARAIADASYTLEEAVGPSQSPAWQERRRAANFYWDITDSPALERLTVGIDEAGFGDSASLGRLLGHYPPQLARDPIFLALAAMQAESANGHAFVEPLQALSERAGAAGFTLAVYPVALDPDFRTSFGLLEGPEAATHPVWAAHGFVDLTDPMPADISDALRRWFAANRSDGHLIRADPDGSWDASEFSSGRPIPSTLQIQAPLLERAARNLDLRLACTAAGLPDLLEPGAWEEGTYDGSASAPDTDPQMHVATAALDRATPPLEITSWDEMIEQLQPFVRYRGEKDHYRDGIVSLRISPAAVDPAFLEKLRSDLLCDDLIEDYGHAWIEGRTLCAYTRTSLDLRLLTAVLADTPRPIHLVIDRAEEGHAEFRLASG